MKRGTWPNGMWGIALVIATEATLFGSLIATYFYLRLQSPSWPPPGVPAPDITLPLVLTGILILTAIPLYAAVRAAGADNVRRAIWLVVLAFCVQAAYLGLQVHLFVHDFNDFTPRGSAYGSIYFTLLGVDHVHVVVGLILDVWLIGKLLQGLTSYRMVALRVIALYWYFVALVGVAVVFTQLYPSL